ncbi:hypothetical protein L596_018267 [Steinernema carpocapsae]|uniref:Uncharacterized protein n=1 Tax=Steinernema carpocapsae TaxID=34508 RepID=A0A4U5N4H6_STECR|nr:hypothetical protein L596_018267 [Steinernema carpocapsae]
MTKQPQLHVAAVSAFPLNRRIPDSTSSRAETAYTARSARRCNLSTRIGRSSASSTTLKSDDPDTDAEQTGFRPNLDREPYHGIGQLFAAEAAKSLCRRLGIDFIIRSYQAPLHGYAFGAWLQRIHDEGRQHGSLRGSPRRHGHVPRLNSITMVIITIKQLKVSENFQKNRAEDVERMKASQKLARKLRDARDTKKSKTDSCAEGFLMQ